MTGDVCIVCTQGAHVDTADCDEVDGQHTVALGADGLETMLVESAEFVGKGAIRVILEVIEAMIIFFVRQI